MGLLLTLCVLTLLSSAAAYFMPPQALPRCSGSRSSSSSLHMIGAGEQQEGGVSRRELIKSALAWGILGGFGGNAYAAGADALLKSRFGDKLRRAATMLDELQQDIFNEDFDLVSTYPNAFRTLTPIFTKYTDAAFPSDDPVDANSRVALRYEVGRFFGAVERLKRATESRDVREMENAYAAMSVAYDRYLKAGNLYSAYDPVTSTEKYYAGIDDKTLVFAPPTRDPPKIRDAVILIQGPDKGKTGRIIGAEGQERLIVKLNNKVGNISEIKVIPSGYAAKQL